MIEAAITDIAKSRVLYREWPDPERQALLLLCPQKWRHFPPIRIDGQERGQLWWCGPYIYSARAEAAQSVWEEKRREDAKMSDQAVKIPTVDELLDEIRALRYGNELEAGVHMQIADELEKVLAPLREFAGYETGSLLGVIAHDYEHPRVSATVRQGRVMWLHDLAQVIEKRLAPKLSDKS